MSLTDAWLKANTGRAREKTLERADRDGLSIRLSPKGKITFQIRYRYGGRPKRVDLGSYPKLSLKDARAQNEQLRAELEAGRDPKVVLQLDRQSRVQAGTLRELFLVWYESYCKVNKKSPEEILRSFELHVFPRIGALPSAEVTLHEWMDLLDPLARSKPSIAERVLINSKQMYKWAYRRELVPANPLANITGVADLGLKKRVGRRSLSDAEIAWLWEALDQSRMTPKNKLFVKLCLFFACRNGELRLAEISHFDFDAGVWTVPPENHKLGERTGEPLLRPIIPEVVPMLKEAIALSGGKKFLFTNSGTAKVMSRSSTVALPYNLMQWLRRHRKVEMEHWSLHDLRKTARTNFSTLTDQPHVPEVILGHSLPGDWRTYDHHHYLDEQAVVYSRWWHRLMSIVS